MTSVKRYTDLHVTSVKMFPFVFIMAVSSLIHAPLTSGESIDQIIAKAFENVPQSDAPLRTADNGVLYRTELDMLVTPDEYKELYEDNTNSRRTGSMAKRKAIRQKRFRWPNKKVFYKIPTGTFTTNDKQIIDEAIQQWEDFTCIRFQKADRNTKNFIQFTNNGGCSSRAGMSGGSQPLNLGRGCIYKGLIIHEIGHAIGFWHEQNRPDRDNYIRIKKKNIMKRDRYNFHKLPAKMVKTYGVPYDYLSIMHYEGNTFRTRSAADKGRRTIETLNVRDQDKIGQRFGLSFYDVMLANKMYKCHAGCPNRKRCGHDSYMASDCKCYCKGDFSKRNPGGSPVRLCGGGSVKPTGNSDCKDKYPNCSVWAQKKNYCKNGWETKRFCKKSCKFC